MSPNRINTLAESSFTASIMPTIRGIGQYEITKAPENSWRLNRMLPCESGMRDLYVDHS